MLHINIVGVVTSSDNSTRRLVTCSLSLDLFKNVFHYHVTQFHCCNVSITIQEKTKTEQNAINSCHVLQFHVLQFHVLRFRALQVGLSISCPAISCLAILMVRHFHVRHFSAPPLQYSPAPASSINKTSFFGITCNCKLQAHLRKTSSLFSISSSFF